MLLNIITLIGSIAIIFLMFVFHILIFRRGGIMDRLFPGYFWPKIESKEIK